MAILTEVWARDIAEKLFPNDSFVMNAISDDPWVNNKKVHRPQAGALPTVERNRSVFPAVAAQRSDSDNEYDLDEFTSTPTLIRDIEEVEVSYNKRSSVLKNHIDVLNLQIANWLMYKWSGTGASQIIRTTGTDIVSNLPGATGNRKRLTLADVMAARTKFNDADIPEEGRNILIPASMYDQLLLDEADILISKDFRGDADISNGVLRKLFGFNIYTRGRNNVLRYTNAATPVVKEPGAASATTDNAACLVWHKDFVARAKGGVKVYSKIDEPSFYGSIFSALARAGGQKIYTDGTGVLSIVEAAGT